MTEIKLDSKVTPAVGAGITPFVGAMWAGQKGRWVGIVEVAHLRRAEPGAIDTKPADVKLRLTQCEIAPDEHVDQIRELMQALYKLRTAQGTLDDNEVVEHQVISDRLKWAVDVMLWPPQAGDMWTAGGDEPWFGFIDDDGDTKLINALGEVRTANEVFADRQRMDLKARRRVKHGDDSS